MIKCKSIRRRKDKFPEDRFPFSRHIRKISSPSFRHFQRFRASVSGEDIEPPMCRKSIVPSSLGISSLPIETICLTTREVGHCPSLALSLMSAYTKTALLTYDDLAQVATGSPCTAHLPVHPPVNDCSFECILLIGDIVCVDCNSVCSPYLSVRWFLFLHYRKGL